MIRTDGEKVKERIRKREMNLDSIVDEILDIDDVKKLEEPTVLVPKFSANVTFNANGGVVTTNNAETYVVGLSKITTLPNASKSGYNFDGWFTEANGGTQVTLDALKSANVPTTVYAHYTVRSTGGGGGGGGGGVSTNTITVKKDEGSTVTPAGDTNGKVTVPTGSDKNFVIKADDGYTITDVIVDG